MDRIKAVLARLKAKTESTRRTVRGVLQNIAAGLVAVAALAVPATADAINAVLHFIHLPYTVTPGLMTAAGVLLTALAALVTKVQNLIEGRDKVESVEDLKAEIDRLTSALDEVETAGRHVADEVHESLPPAHHQV
jgi:uncharacterized protein YoxC